MVGYPDPVPCIFGPPPSMCLHGSCLAHARRLARLLAASQEDPSGSSIPPQEGE